MKSIVENDYWLLIRKNSQEILTVLYKCLQNETQTNKDAFSTILCTCCEGWEAIAATLRPCGIWQGTMVGYVCHAEVDFRNPLTGVVAQHTTVSALEKGAESASVCGMSALCLSESSEEKKQWDEEGWSLLPYSICTETKFYSLRIILSLSTWKDLLKWSILLFFLIWRCTCAKLVVISFSS